MTTTDLPLGPVLDTSSAPASGARQVEARKPDLLLTQEHHMCPGCGEPIAVRQFLETITQLDAVKRAVGVAGRAPVSFIGGVSTDHSGFGVGRILDVEVIAERLLALHEDREQPLIPGYDVNSYELQPHQQEATR